MARKIKYYLVAADALPEIFIRVAEAKCMMQTGEADTVGAATKMAGISRSAFYKYKDAVQPFNDMKSEHIITLSPGFKSTSKKSAFTSQATPMALVITFFSG